MAKPKTSDFDLSGIKNRILRFEQVAGRDLSSHVGNWRDHPEQQARALVGVLKQIGIADVLLGWHSERNGGRLTVYDGHLRKDLGPDVKWWVAITDLSDSEADFMLATLDTLALNAIADAAQLESLLGSISVDDPAVSQMLADLAADSGLVAADSVDFKEYDESAADDVEMLTCPHCGKTYPK